MENAICIHSKFPRREITSSSLQWLTTVCYVRLLFNYSKPRLMRGFVLLNRKRTKSSAVFKIPGLKLPLLIKMKLASKQGNVWQGLIGQFGLLAAV